MDKALLVGINKYPGAPLRGCVNDVTDAAKLITDKTGIGFDPKNVRLLTDARATTAAIKERLQWLVTGLKPGDRILFWYSGHGAQVASRAKSGEVDGLDEVICPVDFDWSDAHLIKDKQFHQFFGSVPEGVKAFWVSDSCHSGDLTRDAGGLGGRLSRAMPMPEDIQWRNDVAKDAGMKPKALGPQDLPNIVLISGCQSNQTSADATFAKRANGALSYYLLRELKERPAQGMSDTITKVRQALVKNRFSQVPQLEGPAPLLTKPFLK